MPLLFAYGTLRQGEVQRSTFGRSLEGRPDVLVGWVLEEPRADGGRGGQEYPNVRFTGRPEDRVGGAVFEISDAELAAADRYEAVDAYERVAATLASGGEAWVYVDARGRPR